MSILESLQMAFKSIWTNKMRSILTMLGIIIGIASVIAVMALGSGGEKAIGSEFESIGLNRMFIFHNWREDIASKDYMRHGDAEALERAFADKVDGFSVTVSQGGKYINREMKKQQKISIQGVSESYDNIQFFDMQLGRFLTKRDVLTNRKVMIIEEKFAKDVFGKTDVIGEQLIVEINSQSVAFVIAGVYKEKTSSMMQSFGISQDPTVYVPNSTLENISGTGDFVSQIEANIKEGEDAKAVLDEMIKLIERRHHNTGENLYQGQTAEGQLDLFNNFMGILTGIISAIAAISLLVGGIGVMNIMLVSVTERTREIGIRKALGAKHRDVLRQFLVEAVIISGLGGVIGTLLGVALSYIFSSVVKIPPSVDLKMILIAWVFSAGVGIFFGIYPANKAAKLDPIDALRYE
jgi:putative ABC transport system permease protein